MGIPHPADAAFYHPLGSRAERTSGAVWLGSARFVPAKVGLGLGGPVTALPLGPESAFGAEVASDPPKMAAVGDGRFVLAYIAEANGAWIRAGRAEGGSVVEWGTPLCLAPVWTDRVALAALGGAVAVSRHDSREDGSDVWLCSLSGLELSAGPPAARLPGRVESLSAMSPDTLAACYILGGEGWGLAGSASGGSLTLGTPSVFSGAALAAEIVSIGAADAVVLCEDAATGAQTCGFGRLSGDPPAFLWYMPSALGQGQGAPCFSAAVLSPSSLVLCHCGSTGAMVRAAAVSGTAVDIGEPLGPLPGPASAAALAGLVAIAWRVPSPEGDSGESAVVTVDGLSIRLGPASVFAAPSGSMWHPGVAASGGQALVSYREDGFGKIRVGSAAAVGASLVGDGRLHRAAVGAAKAVFSFWFRS